MRLSRTAWWGRCSSTWSPSGVATSAGSAGGVATSAGSAGGVARSAGSAGGVTLRQRLWLPKRVLVTRPAAEQPHTAEPAFS
jgi:hypothetical protein